MSSLPQRFPGRVRRRAAAAVLAVGATVLPFVVLAPSAGAAGTSGASGQAGPSLDARRVDRVPAPVLTWRKCLVVGECATAKLPLDYDDPTGPTTDVVIGRSKAADPAKKIGTLFVNPGGPGGSAAGLAINAKFFFAKDILDRFDIVGVDPRGIGLSASVRCFATLKAQRAAFAGFEVNIPLTEQDEAGYIASSREIGRACGTTGQPLTGAMSTAEVARDMDVIRRTLGDSKLTYLGFSYGSYLGQVYANMFPDRVRALVIDGVVDPVGWVGTDASKDRPVFDRLRSADGASAALTEYLRRCAAAGRRCAFSAGDPAAKFAALAARLAQGPVTISDPDAGTVELDYDTVMFEVLEALYDIQLDGSLAQSLDLYYRAVFPPAGATAADRVQLLAQATARRSARQVAAAGDASGDFYDNGLEAYLGVICSDTRSGQFPRQVPAWAAKADARAPYFGRIWAWATAPCASRTWGAVDEDAYRGPFNRRTAAPVLVVGNYHDPATNYAGAVAASRLLPNSRLLTSDSWGHTAYGTSACVTDAIGAYLISNALPAEGTVCVGDSQPFAKSSAARGAVPGQGQPIPVAPFLPGMTGTTN